MLFALSICLHVVPAVVGLGQILGVGVLASTMRKNPTVPQPMLAVLRLFLRGSALALATVFLAGIAVEYTSGGAFHETWWFRLSFFQMPVLGALNALSLRALRRLEGGRAKELLGRIALRAWVMSALVAEITLLMELKPW